MAMSKDSVQFSVERTYTVRRPKFSLFKSVEYLDPARLAKGAHEIELGRFEGGCCDCPIMGMVKDGLLVGIDIPKCDAAVEMPAGFKKRLQTARKALPRTEPGQWEDIPVAQLVTSRAARSRLVIIITTVDDCVEICTVMSNGLKICFICCPGLGWCIGPSDPHLALF